ncbi:MAG TPA: hypothetical protein VGR73_17410 [Bryobacteraceae bacterium]|nr:hypothetical protein [Bryobacteraceae bacterium]
MSEVESTPAPLAQAGFLERPLPARIILGSFPLMTLPLAAALILTPQRGFLIVYLWLFAITHFVITLTVYLQRQNLRHFAATERNIFLFFIVPLLIFVAFYVIGVFRLRLAFPVFAVLLSAAIRLLDFNHFSRQAFGVYQLFKVRSGLRGAASLKRTENAYFACLTALLFTTFLAGGVFPLLGPGARRFLGAAAVPSGPPLLGSSLLRPLALAAAFAALILLAVAVARIVRAWARAGRPTGLRAALTYLAFQTFSALLGIFSFPLYAATLAIHYVEYHVLMYPRCFHATLDDASGLDGWFADLRRRPIFFYLLLVILAGVVTMCTLFSASIASGEMAGPSTRYLALVAVFDGLFVFHYFIEMLIWKFGDPFFRRTLAGLYFAPRSSRPT